MGRSIAWQTDATVADAEAVEAGSWPLAESNIRTNGIECISWNRIEYTTLRTEEESRVQEIIVIAVMSSSDKMFNTV